MLGISNHPKLTTKEGHLSTIPHLAQAMRTLLSTTADSLARQTGFVKRQRNLTGASFARTLVFAWLADPDATCEARSQTAAAACGLDISAQGLEQRLSTEEAAIFLHALLEETLKTLIAADPVAIPILGRFSGVYLYDGTVVSLPDALKEHYWPGCGGGSTNPSGAALKIGVGLDLLSGALAGPVLGAARVHDRALLAAHLGAIPEGALQVADLGFFDFKLFRTLDSRGSYWLSRLKAGTAVLDRRTGRRYDLVRLLSECSEPELEVEVLLLGEEARLEARVLAVRVAGPVAGERKRKLRKEAQRRQRGAVSSETLALAEWNIAATNAPEELFGLEEAFTVLRARWQIEQLFSLWKKHGELDKSRSEKPFRVLCEVYAKLIALVIQHWVFLMSNWTYPERSLMKASGTVRGPTPCCWQGHWRSQRGAWERSPRRASPLPVKGLSHQQAACSPPDILPTPRLDLWRCPIIAKVDANGSALPYSPLPGAKRPQAP
jgi:hypothetical protein